MSNRLLCRPTQAENGDAPRVALAAVVSVWPPQLAGATLLVPGYIDSTEVERIARFIAAIDPRIPYSLLAFAPQFQMRDLPRTSHAHAEAAAHAALRAGLVTVRIGNLHLLSQAYEEPFD